MNNITTNSYNLLQLLRKVNACLKGEHAPNTRSELKDTVLLEFTEFNLTIYATTGYRLYKETLFCTGVIEPFNVIIDHNSLKKINPQLSKNKHAPTEIICKGGFVTFITNKEEIEVIKLNIDNYPVEKFNDFIKINLEATVASVSIETSILKNSIKGSKDTDSSFIKLQVKNNLLYLSHLDYEENIPILSVYNVSNEFDIILKPLDLYHFLLVWPVNTITLNISSALIIKSYAGIYLFGLIIE